MSVKEKKEKVHKEIPWLIWLLPLSAVLMSLFAWSNSDSLYAGYSPDPGKSPYFTLVLEGIRDGVLPKTVFETQQSPEKKQAEIAEQAIEQVAATRQQEPEETEVKTAKESVPKAKRQDEKSETAGEVRKIRREAAAGKGDGSEKVPEPVEVTYEVPPESGCPVMGAYDYGNATAQYRGPEGWEPELDTTGMFAATGPFYPLGEVEEDYFADALFIGDSRVDGLCDYGDLEEYATFACKDSLTIYKLFEEQLRFHDPYGNRGYATLSEVLSFRAYGKIYLQIGINEIGTGSTRQFYEEYRTVLQKLRASQPMAVIYIDGIMHVTAAKSSSDAVMNNVNIADRNRAISTLANGRDIFYLDMNPSVCDENGNLLSELSMDNAHLKAASHGRWHDFLLTHAALK